MVKNCFYNFFFHLIFILASYPIVDNITYDNLKYIEYQGKRIAQESTVSHVMGNVVFFIIINYIAFSKQYKHNELLLFPVYLNTPLIQLFYVFCEGIHRVPVMNAENKVHFFLLKMKQIFL